MARIRISLANKCQIMFGGAVLLILMAALSVPWLRMQALVHNAQREIASQVADVWLSDPAHAAFHPGLRITAPAHRAGTTPPISPPPGQIRYIAESSFRAEAARDPFFARALAKFRADPHTYDVIATEPGPHGRTLDRYARAIQRSDLSPAHHPGDSHLEFGGMNEPIVGVLLVDIQDAWAAHQLLLNSVYAVTAGLLAVLLAIAAFWYITTRVILSPVRVLRDTAEKVAEGDLNIRSDINTGDEFEDLSRTFNQMLTSTKQTQDKLRELNRQLDLKLGELAESNLSLYEANRIKGDFLANVSHELRTPLNSIVGFAEVLSDTVDGQGDPTGDKRRRYIENILASSKSLLQLINDLLDLAKIEAGRIDLHLDRMSVSDTCEVLLNLIRPQADRAGVTLALNAVRGLPVIQTDPGKFQQILFNFLSNAVKFTPEGGRVELGAAPEFPQNAGVHPEPTAVRVWVKDTGPGIPVEKHQEVFEKFRQLDSSHTRQHGGTGLGLAISKELARLLQGRIELDSDVGRGATFTLILPLSLETQRSEPLMPELVARP